MNLLPRRFYPHSLTTRLGLLFALVAGVMFAAVGMYLYSSLARQLEARDDAELIEKIGVIRLLVAQAESVAAIKNNQQMFLESAAGRDHLTLVVTAADGSRLFDSRMLDDGSPFVEPGAQLPLSAVVPASQMPAHHSVRLLHVGSGAAIRAVAAWCYVKASGEQIEVTVARTTSERMALLKTYRTEVLAAILSGTLLAAGLGYLVVRRGLRPVRVIAAQAGSITAYRLEMRMDVAEAPQELQEMVQAFNQMLDRLQLSFQRLSRFSADIAHDLRTPLNNLMIQTQVALSQPRSNDDYQTLLASNVEEYERLARMAESMLFLARAEHASVLPAKVALDAAEQLQRIVDYFEGIAEEAGVTLRIVASGSVSADAILFRRAVSNLVVNAIRYTAPGSEILLTAQSSNDATTVSVSNPGIGIDSQHLPKIFDRFYRADAARQDSATSAGLGLAIVKSIMSLHGGRADAFSTPHQLTRFDLIFPKRDLVLRTLD